MTFTPEQKEALSAETFVRFMRMVHIPPQKGACWTWTGNKPDDRYGHFSIGGEVVKAHRWIYELIVGPIPEGLMMRHRCDNPQCVNPMHLETGTASQNIQDIWERGRGFDRKGERHPMARLTAEKVIQIRKWAANGETQHALAAEYGVRRGQIGKIVHRLNWSHI